MKIRFFVTVSNFQAVLTVLALFAVVSMLVKTFKSAEIRL